jgi:hypothetical protein
MYHDSRNGIERAASPVLRGGRPGRVESRAQRTSRPALVGAGSRIGPAINPPRPLRSTNPELLRLEVRTLMSVSVLQNFIGISHNYSFCGCLPPDSMMAVGPTTVLGAVNTAIVLKNKTGGTLASPENIKTFFSSIYRSGDDFSDPYVLYDDQAQVYYVGIIEYPKSASTGYFDFAVSNSSNPTGLTVGTGSGQWTVFSQITSVNEGGTQFPDFPKMGWNKDAVFVSFNQFAGGNTFSHDLVLAIKKSTILAHGTLTTFQTDVSTNSDRRILIPARMHGSTGGTEYLVQTDAEGSSHGTVNVVAETGYLTSSPRFVTTTIQVNAYSNSPGVPGLTNQIDDRMLSADWLNNDLVASMDVGVGGLNLARWYEFSTSGTPKLVSGQQGNISAGSGVSTSFPSIAIDPNGDIAMTYIESSSTQPFSMYVTGRFASDPAGTMQTGVEIAAGVAPVPPASRGGDYSATEYDPSNTSQFWSTNEYKFDSGTGAWAWATRIANFTISAASVAGPTGTSTGPAEALARYRSAAAPAPGALNTSRRPPVGPPFGIPSGQRPVLELSALRPSDLAASGSWDRPSLVPGGRNAGVALGPRTRTITKPSIPAVDLVLSLPVPQVLETEGNRLWPAIRKRPG